MAEMTQFRAALHGYNREDVVAFIDRMTREHEDMLRRAQEKNDQLRAQLEEAQEALAAAKDSEDTERELELAKAQLAELMNRNEALEARNQELEAALEEAKRQPEPEEVLPPVTQELSEPIPPVEQVLPVNLAPAKDYTELELAAYRRAELTERLARERSVDVYRQVQSVFNQANEKLDAGKSDLEQLSRTLTADVNEMLTLLTNLNSTYRQAESSFAEIGARNREILENNG